MGTIINTRRSALYVLLYLLLVLLHPVTASAFNRSQKYPHAPPPLGEHEWVNKTNLNYTRLYDEYVDGIVCAFTPVGVFGSFVWFSMIVSIILSFVKVCTLEEGEKSAASFIMGLLTTLFAMYTFVQGIRTYMRCNSVRGFDIIRVMMIMSLCESCIAVIGGLLTAILYLRDKGSLLVTIYLLDAGGICAGYLVAWLSYFESAKVAGILEKVAANPDRIGLTGLLTSVFVVPLLMLGIVVGMRAWHPVVRKLYPDTSWRIIWIASWLFAVGSSVVSSFGNIILGKIVGDPWGSYALEAYWGKLTAVLTAVIPTLEMILLFL